MKFVILKFCNPFYTNDLNIDIVAKVEVEIVDDRDDDISEVIASFEVDDFEDVVPSVHCRPTSIFPTELDCIDHNR